MAEWSHSCVLISGHRALGYLNQYSRSLGCIIGQLQLFQLYYSQHSKRVDSHSCQNLRPGDALLAIMSIKRTFQRWLCCDCCRTFTNTVNPLWVKYGAEAILSALQLQDWLIALLTRSTSFRVVAVGALLSVLDLHDHDIRVYL